MRSGIMGTTDDRTFAVLHNLYARSDVDSPTAGTLGHV